MAFKLPDLPYAYNALEPVIDATTMEIHHSKHHAAYVNNLNKAIEGNAALESKDIVALISALNSVPEGIRTAVRNNGGGHYNHSEFWLLMAPKGKGGQPSAEFSRKIDSDLGGFTKFKEAFTQAALNRFGSGWAWLILNPQGRLEVTSTPNQDNPLMGAPFVEKPGKPILGIDVWEHAYYLKYQNRRADYVQAWWDVVNWNRVNENFSKATR